jgi:hypothetical protein
MFLMRYERHLQIKIKAISVTSRGDLQGCEMLRIQHCLDNWLIDRGEIVIHKHRPRFTPQKHFLFLSLVLISVRV